MKLTARQILQNKHDIYYSPNQLKNLIENPMTEPSPYTIDIRQGNQYLSCTGGTHLGYYDDENKSSSAKKFEEAINERWDLFVANNSGNTIAIIEGGEIPKSEWDNFEPETSGLTDDEKYYIAKEKWGEAGTITLKAKGLNIEVISPEPTDEEFHQHLLTTNPEENVNLFYFIRKAVQNHRDNPQHTAADFLSAYADEATVKRLIETYTRLLNETFDYNNFERLDFLTNPLIPQEEGTAINDVARSGGYRELYIVSRIKDLWDSGKNIFVVYGSKHIPTQEPIIREFTSTAKHQE